MKEEEEKEPGTYLNLFKIPALVPPLPTSNTTWLHFKKINKQKC